MKKIKCFSCKNVLREGNTFSCTKQGVIDPKIRDGADCSSWDGVIIEKIAKAKKEVKEKE